ncbi:hypothetical protein [Halorhodospira sp. 9622]|uniref:hypothetical protein n=1 Tax=Halorhodospira sp. 9622 TaxID=2899136 RepID=UPI001EE7D45D|nr:hypothetical protein [Halorhodospira sp. 9622]MCG5538948.1 hypothetical protein [Halorhodospira sp. 9622]
MSERHKADRIMDAALERIGEISRLEGGVHRARAYPHPEDALPAASVYLGTDDPTELASSGIGHIDSRLTLRVAVATRGSLEAIDAELLELRRAVTCALMRDPRLGLEWVIDTREGAAAEPEIDPQGRQPVAFQELVFLVDYRRSREDPAQ